MQSKVRSRSSRFRLIAKLFFLPESGWWGIGLLGVLLALVFFVKALDIRNSYVWADLITAATDRKAELVCHLALLYAAVFAGSAIVATLLRFTEELLGLRWRDWLTRHLSDRYLAGRAYHRIKESAQLYNPDQRISEDVKTFTTSTLSIVLILTNAAVALLGFAGVLWSITPWLLAGAVGYAAFGTLMTVLLDRRRRFAAGLRSSDTGDARRRPTAHRRPVSGHSARQTTSHYRAGRRRANGADACHGVGSEQLLLEHHDRLLRLQGDGTWMALDTIEAAEAEWPVEAAPILGSLQVG